MEYAVEMGSDPLVYVSSVIKIGWGIEMLVEWFHGHTAWRSYEHAFIFPNKESILGIIVRT
jgi:hypothetical protein